MSARRGRFVVIEGLDGAGTTTQARLLGENQRRPWWFSREKIEANAKHRVVLEP